MRRFRTDAKKDNYTSFRKHLELLDLPDRPDLLEEGTILVLQACVAYRSLDGRVGRDFKKFMDLQQYERSDTTDALYAFTFDLHGFAYARLITDSNFQSFDLADLYNHPWFEYERVGYETIHISRTDWKELTDEDLQRLKDEVTADLRYDFSEDDLDITFDEFNPIYLNVYVQDVYGPEELGFDPQSLR